MEKDNSVSIHHRNLQVLATEMFKVNMNLTSDLMNDIFIKRTNRYTLRRNDTFSIRQASSVYHGTKSSSLLRPKIWQLMPSQIKYLENVEIFKRRIKKQTPSQYPCRLC